MTTIRQEIVFGTETIGTDDATRLEQTSLTNLHVVVDGHIGPQPGTLANPAMLADKAAGPNQHAITQYHAGLDDRIGSVTVGKQADLACIDLSAAETQPVHNVLSQLVYSVGRQNVSDVWIAGAVQQEPRFHRTCRRSCSAPLS